MKSIVALLLLLISLSVHADSFFVLVGYVCDRKSDRLILTYDGAYNEEGETMVENRSATQWNPWALTTVRDGEYIDSLRTIRRKCRLSDGIYNIVITPVPGNRDVTRHCGAWITASALVTKGNKTVHSVPRFENNCQDTDSPIVSRVTIRSQGEEPEVSTVQWNEFYK